MKTNTIKPYRCVCLECEPMSQPNPGRPASEKAPGPDGKGLLPVKDLFKDLMARVIPGRKAS